MNENEDSHDYDYLESEGCTKEWLQALREGRVQKASDYARRESISAALSATIDVSGYIELPIPTNFGHLWSQHFAIVKKEISEGVDPHLEALFVVSNRVFVYAREYESARNVGYSLFDVPPITVKLKESQAHETDTLSDTYGYAITLLTYLPSERDPLDELFTHTFFKTPEIRGAILAAMGLIWFYDAAASYSTDPAGAMNKLFDASQAIVYAEQILMRGWEASNRNPAAEMAKRRHAEHYALADDVRSYWRKNIDPALSAQKAAEEIIRSNVVLLSHRKIAEIISALRRTEPKRK